MSFMQKNINQDRIFGIDLLKIICMLGVVFLHVYGHGQIIASCDILSVNYYGSNLLNSLWGWSVDCFVLITGCFSINSNTKISKIIKLYLTVWFYSVFITTVIAFIFKGSVSAKTLLFAFFPLLRNQYWFFSCYFALYMFLPIINIVFKKLSRQQIQYIIVISVIFYSIIARWSQTELFLNRGYSILSFPWFIILYFIGAYIRYYDLPIQLKNRTLTVLFVFCLLFQYLATMGVNTITYLVMGTPKNPDLFTGNTSIFTLIAACLLLKLFMSIQVNHTVIRKMTLFIGPLTFGVYLIHDNNAFRSTVWNLIGTNKLAMQPLYLLFFGSIGIALLVFVFCLLIDFLRAQLFNLIKINNLCQGIENTFVKMFPSIKNIFD